MGTKNWHLYTLSPHHLAPKGLVAQLVERRCEGVGSIPTQVLRFFFSEKKSWDLYTSATAMIFNYYCAKCNYIINYTVLIEVLGSKGMEQATIYTGLF